MLSTQQHNYCRKYQMLINIILLNKWCKQLNYFDFDIRYIPMDILSMISLLMCIQAL